MEKRFYSQPETKLLSIKTNANVCTEPVTGSLNVPLYAGPDIPDIIEEESIF